LVLVGLLIWLLGPLLPFLEDWTGRLLVALAILLGWTAAGFAYIRTSHRRDAVLRKAIVQGGGDTIRPTTETAALQGKLIAAMQELDDARLGEKYLHELPWYAIIGPPGAGKTTALMNAGLNFASNRAGASALQGVGGTRSCEWWFSQEAVLIDTAGRYTTQDSDARADKAGWHGFLALLKQTRPTQPLNGVIIAIALNEIATPSDTQASTHAFAIRQRVEELQTHVGLTMPVYLMFTKTDLIAGFDAFFADLDEIGRSKVFGITFDPEMDPSTVVGTFASRFRDLMAQQDTRLFERLQTERSLERRAILTMLPGNMRELEQPLASFVEALTAGGDLFLRGVYFTSATQEGTPIDRVTGLVARTFGLDLPRSETPRSGSGRSFFVGGLFREVALAESALVSMPPAIARRRALLRGGALASSIAGVALASAYLWHARAEGFRAVEAAGKAVERYHGLVSALPLDRVANAQLERVEPLLSAVSVPPVRKQRASLYGLEQGPKLDAAVRVTYQHALERVFLPRLLWRLENQVRDSESKTDLLYETTRTYLMLGSAGPLDKESARAWMRQDWQALYPLDQGLRESLLRHFDVLLAETLPEVQLDAGLVAHIRDVLLKVSPAQRAYSRIRFSPAAQRLSPWRPSDALGPVGIGLFNRTSGKPLAEGIAGFFTTDGFRTVLLPSLDGAARSITADSWIVEGRRSAKALDPVQTRLLEAQILRLYQIDYVRSWDGMVSDLSVAPLKSVSRAAQDLYVLASPQSPMRALLTSIARQVTLAASVKGGQQPGTDRQGAGAEIDERYRSLRDLVGTGPGAPIDQVLRSLNDMQQQFAKAAASSTDIAILAGQVDPSLALRAEALRQPEPLGRWLTTLATSGAALRSGTKP
jgi:type VI secretion system protein ImpL